MADPQSVRQVGPVMTTDDGREVVGIQATTVADGGADMAFVQVGDRFVAVLSAPVTALERDVVLAAVKARLAVGQGALASHMDALGMRDALEALARRS